MNVKLDTCSFSTTVTTLNVCKSISPRQFQILCCDLFILPHVSSVLFTPGQVFSHPVGPRWIGLHDRTTERVYTWLDETEQVSIPPLILCTFHADNCLSVQTTFLELVNGMTTDMLFLRRLLRTH